MCPAALATCSVAAELGLQAMRNKAGESHLLAAAALIVVASVGTYFVARG